MLGLENDVGKNSRVSEGEVSFFLAKPHFRRNWLSCGFFFFSTEGSAVPESATFLYKLSVHLVRDNLMIKVLF